MAISFGNTSSPHNKINKTFTSVSSTSTYTLLEETKIDNPSFVVEVNQSLDVISKKINFVYWSDMNRYYFATIVQLAPGLYRFDCTLDLLMTFRNEILQAEGIAKRCNIENRLIQDEAYQLQSNRDWEVKMFPETLNKNLQNVLIVAGG